MIKVFIDQPGIQLISILLQKAERKELLRKAVEEHVNGFRRAMSGEGNYCLDYLPT